ncbi:MAG: TRAP transporter small permease subunit [Gammaproteobacteria bacterium]|nr:TRAP transporter small permease subunit [Gammaproteobacteria bacterium]
MSVQLIIKRLHLLEGLLLVILLVTMILLAVIQVFIRNVFDTGMVWSEAAVRVMVLWITFLGAMVASCKGQHISIDLVSHYLPKTAQRRIQPLISVLTAVICFTASYIGLRYVLMEYDDGGVAFAGIPAWCCELIIPVGFLVLAMRYLFSIFLTSDQSTS